MQIDSSFPSQSLLGSAFAPSKAPLSARPVGQDRVASFNRATCFSPNADWVGYGADARLRTPGGASLAQSPEAAADARTLRALEARDQEVRRNEAAQGEAVAGSNFIYQTGPDGERYAIGTTAHMVRAEDSAGHSKGSLTQPASSFEDASDLSQADKVLLDKLQARDAKVRQHEAAHIAAGGGQVQGSPTYEYQTGPDGRNYAIGGSVNISIKSFSGDPEESARQARVARRAALAAGAPSAKDMQVAAHATELSARAKQNALDSYERQGAFTPKEAQRFEAVY